MSSDEPSAVSSPTRVEFDALKKRVVALERRYCSRCGSPAFRAVGKACGEQPCPLRQFLSPEDAAWRLKPGVSISPARLPILAADGSTLKTLAEREGK